MKLNFLSLLIVCSGLLRAQNITRIAFGSCSHQDESIPIFDTIAKQNPGIFIFLGDNIYGDSQNMDTMRARYIRLASKPGYHALLENTVLLSTWDDHDYGGNDAGKNYPMKKESREMFLNFFNEPETSPRRKHEGIYTSYQNNYEGKTLQVIMLDCRYFRDDLKKARWPRRKKKGIFYKLTYLPTKKKEATLLGQAQWAWLEEELKKPADLRLICSSIQFAAGFNGFETWANFPLEQKRMTELIKKTKANGVIFLSGDTHYGEISKLTVPDLYPLYDVTSSGLTARREYALINPNRIDPVVLDNNFGMLTIEWKTRPVKISMEIWDLHGFQRTLREINLDEIRFKE